MNSESLGRVLSLTGRILSERRQQETAREQAIQQLLLQHGLKQEDEGRKSSLDLYGNLIEQGYSPNDAAKAASVGGYAIPAPGLSLPSPKLTAGNQSKLDINQTNALVNLLRGTKGTDLGQLRPFLQRIAPGMTDEDFNQIAGLAITPESVQNTQERNAGNLSLEKAKEAYKLPFDVNDATTKTGRIFGTDYPFTLNNYVAPLFGLKPGDPIPPLNPMGPPTPNLPTWMKVRELDLKEQNQNDLLKIKQDAQKLGREKFVEQTRENWAKIGETERHHRALIANQVFGINANTFRFMVGQQNANYRAVTSEQGRNYRQGQKTGKVEDYFSPTEKQTLSDLKGELGAYMKSLPYAKTTTEKEEKRRIIDGLRGDIRKAYAVANGRKVEAEGSRSEGVPLPGSTSGRLGDLPISPVYGAPPPSLIPIPLPAADGGYRLPPGPYTPSGAYGPSMYPGRSGGAKPPPSGPVRPATVKPPPLLARPVPHARMIEDFARYAKAHGAGVNGGADSVIAQIHDAQRKGVKIGNLTGSEARMLQKKYGIPYYPPGPSARKKTTDVSFEPAGGH